MRCGGYKARVLGSAKRPRAPLWSVAGFAVLAAIAGIFFALSAAEAKRDARVTDLVRPTCENTRLTRAALERLVRMERHAATDQNHAIQAITAYCLVSR
jgi:hypothetical protein